MIIEQKILNKINVIEGESITENIEILYEFLLDQGYNWLRRNVNYLYSSSELAEDIKHIIDADISNLDFKYCMELLGIEGEMSNDGMAYYPIKKEWYYKMKQWSNERKDKNDASEKYRRMRKAIIEGNSNYRFI